MPRPSILVVPGDGIGPEVIDQALRVLDTVAQIGRIELELGHADAGGVAIVRHGIPLPDETLSLARSADAILLGSIGGPEWDFLPDPRDRAGNALLTLRRKLDLFANIRPIQVFQGLEAASTLRADVLAGVDMVIVRELTGGMYFGEPRGVVTQADGQRVGRNTLVYSENEVRRVTRVACELSRRRRCRLHSIDKANVLETMGLWRDVVTDTCAAAYPDLEVSHMFVDNAAMQIVRNPRQFDVIVTENMFGDILSDCAAMVSGSLGMLPSASLGDRKNMLGARMGLYEPVHGSAPDIAGRGVANPLAAILSVGLMLHHSLDQPAAAKVLEEAVRTVLREGYRTPDLASEGAAVGTTAMADAVIAALNKAASQAA